MEIIQELQERYIQEFNQSISMIDFLLNFLVVALLTQILAWYYRRYGQSLSDRRRFSNNFSPLALATMLIILIVQSSIALSLGLVGALSVVRYRAAIKDPEELTFLLIAIGLGLAGGANQPMLAVIFVALTLPVLYIVRGRRLPKENAGQLLIYIRTDLKVSEPITSVLKNHLTWIDLKRLHTGEEYLEIDVVTQVTNLETLETLRLEISQLSPATTIQILQQPDILA